VAIAGAESNCRHRAMPDHAIIDQAIVTSSEDVTPKELIAYRNFIKDVARKHDGRPIFNRNRWHAAVVIEQIFKDAREEVRILTGELSNSIFGVQDVIDAAKSFLNSSLTASIQVLSESQIAEDHFLLAALRQTSLRNRILLKVLRPEISTGTAFHFVLADNDSFRFEPNKKIMEAIVQFGAAREAKRLKLTFDNLWTIS
jgi:hypothetical protein